MTLTHLGAALIVLRIQQTDIQFVFGDINTEIKTTGHARHSPVIAIKPSHPLALYMQGQRPWLPFSVFVGER